jgi:DeoR/GlpR family transcriptional regulator of sugar metabolism
VNELCEMLGVSAATVRRDLGDMERRGLLHRVHGGAVSAERLLEEPMFDDKTALAAAEKQRIAEAARTFVGATDTLFLDGGSTVLALARMLADMPGPTLVTNSLRVVSAFSGGGPRLIVVGGELRRRSQTFVGPLTQPMIEKLHVDTAFIGTIGLSVTGGMTTTDPREAGTKELVIAHARRVILLADSSKIGKVSFVRFGDLRRVDTIVTDAGADPKAVRAFRRVGIEVALA